MILTIMKKFYKKYFNHPEAIWLLIFLSTIFGIIILMGKVLAPLFISLIIVYLIESIIKKLINWRIPKQICYFCGYVIFLTLFFTTIILLLLLWKQAISLFKDLPQMLQHARTMLIKWAELYPNFIPNEQLDALVSSILLDLQGWAKHQVSSSLNYISWIVTWLVYLFLIPLLVFFLLKDRNIILQWLGKFIPTSMNSLKEISITMEKQIGNYLRGKVIQICIVSLVNGIIFLYYKLNYAILLAVLVGISVIIPYVGTVLVTIPVILVGYLQWGLSNPFGYMLSSYTIVQILDGNLLVPILFSKVVNLHPIAIVTAVLIFGSWWGIWGIVLAIPLATFIKTIIYIWPLEDHKKIY